MKENLTQIQLTAYYLNMPGGEKKMKKRQKKKLEEVL